MAQYHLRPQTTSTPKSDSSSKERVGEADLDELHKRNSMFLHFEEDFEIPGQDEVFYGSQFHHGVFHFGFVRKNSDTYYSEFLKVYVTAKV